MRQKTGRYLLSFLLALAMVIGLMPGMGLTALADNQFAYTFTATGTNNWWKTGMYYLAHSLANRRAKGEFCPLLRRFSCVHG